MRDGLHVIIYVFGHPRFALPRTHILHESGFWHHLLQFVFLALCVMLWIGFWGFYHRHRVRAFKRQEPPKPLTVAEHAASFSLDSKAIERWQQTKVTTVQFDAANHVASISPVSVGVDAAGDSSAATDQR
jgi:poly-beta-1,6-N-acetyl-D-glucosamine biosynthesis protein PgaD